MKKYIMYVLIIGIFIGGLLFYQHQAYAGTPPTVIKTDLFEDWYLKDISTREILVLKETVFYADQDEKLPVLGTLNPGMKIKVLDGNYYVSPTKVVVLEDHNATYGWQTITKYSFKAGELFYIVQYLGEGVFTVWRENEMFKVDLRGIKGLSVYGNESNYWGMLVDNAQWGQGKAWAKIQTANGQSGWVLWNQNFGNTKISDYRGIYVFINGKYVEELPSYGDKSFAREDGKLLLPLEMAASIAGASVVWNKDSSVATVYYQSKQLQIIPGKRIAILNGNPFDMGGIPNWRRATFYIPLRAFYEALGGNITWDENVKQVSIELRGN